jgi:death-on-curing protein
MDPVWLNPRVVEAIHDRQLAEHGGGPGLRDANLLESALARPANAAAYGDPDLPQLAALYAAGIIQNHPFLDGNKRTGFLLAYTFLALNGLQLIASQQDVISKTLDLAAGVINVDGYAAWLRAATEPRREPGATTQTQP